MSKKQESKTPPPPQPSEPLPVAPIVSLFQTGTQNIKEGWARLRKHKK